MSLRSCEQSILLMHPNPRVQRPPPHEPRLTHVRRHQPTAVLQRPTVASGAASTASSTRHLHRRGRRKVRRCCSPVQQANHRSARQHAGGRGFGHASLRAHVSTRIERCTRACAGLCGGACTPAASAKWCGLVRALGSQPAPGHDRNRARTLTRTDLKTDPSHQVTAGPSRRVREGQRGRVHRTGLATVAPGMAQAWTTCGWR